MTPQTLSLDELLDLTGNALRRRTLLALLDRDRLDRTDLEASLGIADDEVRSLELRHVHLPKLDAAGVVRVNDDRGTVRRGDSFDQVTPLLRWIRDREGTDR